MTKSLFIGLAGAIALAAPGAAMAQGTGEAEPFVGVSAGYHELGDNDLEDVFDIEVDSGSPIIGVVAGVDVPLGGQLFAGVEGNFHFGTDVIDNEYGASVRIGTLVANGTKIYLRGGYQEVDFDPAEIVDFDLDEFDDLDTSDGDYLLGAGADLRFGPGALRLNLDTVSFDTIRATTGYVLTF